MNLYETTYILNPQSDDATLDRQVKAVNDIIVNNGGKIVHEDRVGTRRMAYEIKDLAQGYYTSTYFEGPGQLPRLLDRHFRLEDQCLRHLTILYEGSVERLKERPEISDVPADRRRPGPPVRQPAPTGPPDADSRRPAEPELTESEDIDQPDTVDSAAPAPEAEDLAPESETLSEETSTDVETSQPAAEPESDIQSEPLEEDEL
ncbi:MAG: 30S ribosomal protein S6 [Candidatus Zixiibacteriota bacterium]|nr:MAG: 30S ribosomal protein S6 [candidate division Zixibacteria bacterium]